MLRATVMAGVGAAAALAGRPVGAVRVLALAVTGLVLLDPLLVLSLGFRLSVAASAGIVVLARPLAAVLPGPAWLRVALAVTLSAQAAVAPLLVPAFGPMPVAAVPANLLAEPVAGLVMMWGCTAGLVAGLVPDWAAAVLHLPTRLGLWWVAGVARLGAGAPFGAIGLLGVGAIAVLARRGRGAPIEGAPTIGRGRPRRRGRRRDLRTPRHPCRAGHRVDRHRRRGAVAGERRPAGHRAGRARRRPGRRRARRTADSVGGASSTW